MSDLVLVQHASAKECQVQFKSQLQDVLLSHPKWMAAVWGIDKDGKITVSRTTCDFPIADFLGALDLLQQSLEKEISGIDTSALPVAEGFGSTGEALGESQK
jgi:hypothetical protein